MVMAQLFCRVFSQITVKHMNDVTSLPDLSGVTNRNKSRTLALEKQDHLEKKSPCSFDI